MARPTDVPTGGRRAAAGGGAVRAATTEETSPAPREASEGPEPVRPSARPEASTDRRGLLHDARLAWAVATLMTMVAVGLFFSGLGPRQAEAERAAALEAAQLVAAQITTFEGATIEEWVQDMQRRSTSAFAEQVARQFDQTTRDALRAAEARSVGAVEQSFIQELEGDRARAFVLVRQSNASNRRAEVVEDVLRMDIELQKVDGEWLAANVQVLAPPSLAPGATETTPIPPDQTPAPPPSGAPQGPEGDGG